MNYLNRYYGGVRGIVLAGGTGTRLWPVTKAVSKQLLPVYDKPMIYYPLGTLMLAGIREIALITTVQDQEQFKRLLGDGSQFGITLEFLTQSKPEGIAQAFLIAEEFIGTDSVALILGDNIFNGSLVGRNLSKYAEVKGAQVFGYRVKNPEDFGVASVDSNNLVIGIEEKPVQPKSDIAITGLYFYDNTVIRRAKEISISARNELEISELNNSYIKEKELELEILPRGTVWLDGGTPESLHDAASYVRVIEERQGQKICCLEEIAWRNGWITLENLKSNRKILGNNNYGRYLDSLIVEAISS
jgi:glucose-1-phosphate thymidylyltransferase